VGLRGITGVGIVTKACAKRVIDNQYVTGVEGNSHSCTKGYYPRKGFFFILYHTCAAICYMCCKYAASAIHIFLLHCLKINHVTEILYAFILVPRRFAEGF
jgi:hypothetical protein